MAHALIRQLFASIDANRWPELRQYFETDVVYERPGYAPINGIEELIEFYESRRMVAFGNHTLDHIVIEGGIAAAWGYFSGISRSGDALAGRFADTYILRSERIYRRTTFFFRPAL